jgi:hypothetical protein
VEELLETFLNTNAGPWPWTATPFSDGGDNGTDIRFQQGIDLGLDTLNAPVRTTIFGTESSTHVFITSGFMHIFPSFTTVVNESSLPLMRYKTWQQGQPFIWKLNFNPWLAPNNISAHIDHLARAITIVVRSAPSNAIFPGKAFIQETYGAVHWGEEKPDRSKSGYFQIVDGGYQGSWSHHLHQSEEAWSTSRPAGYDTCLRNLGMHELICFSICSESAQDEDRNYLMWSCDILQSW